MKLQSLQDLFVNELQDLYSAENQIIKALPRMAKAASCSNLRQGFETHLEQTRGQVTRLEQIFTDLNVSPKGQKCVAMEGIIEEGNEIMKKGADDGVRDAGLIAAAQRVEHYEIAVYGTVRTWAEQLGLSKAARLLQETLNEEKETNQKLTEIAEKEVNLHAQPA